MRSVKLGHWVKMADTLTLPCCATGSPRNVMGGGVSPGQRRRSRQRNLDPCVSKKECKERRGSGPSIMPDCEGLRRVKCVREGREEEEGESRDIWAGFGSEIHMSREASFANGSETVVA